jgi:subtilisin-like proprotein convertase family protein
VNAGSNYTIPKSTPFALTGSATDAGGGALTYCWEQFDEATTAAMLCSISNLNPAGDNDCVPVATKVTGAIFRSYPPTASPTRYFPKMAAVLDGSYVTTGPDIASEVLPSVARTMNFRLTVRDNVAGQGQTNFGNMAVTVNAANGPFDVTSQALVNQTWTQGLPETITWSVNGTNVAYAANVAGDQFVDILLSTDGGLTFPTVLVSNTPNDGSQVITVPNITATNARVMVKAHSHIFFDVNPKPIAIGYVINSVCNSYTNNTPLAIPDGSGTTTPSQGTAVSNTLNVPVAMNITDVDVNLNVTHTYPGDLVIQIAHPNTTTFSSVWSGACGTNDNFNITLSDGSPAFACAPGMTGTYNPSNPLSVFNGLTSNGTWRLTTADFWSGDTGTINSWGLTICNTTYTLANPDFEFENFTLYPNPNKGDFTIKFTSASTNDIKINVHDMRGRQVYEKSFSNTGAFNQNINLNKVASGVYLVSIIDGAKKTVKRIVVE